MKTVFAALLLFLSLNAQAYTRQDTLRGSNGRGRSWWDVMQYNLTVSVNLDDKTIIGNNVVFFVATRDAGDSMQIDLQTPLVLDSAMVNTKRVEMVKDGNVWWLLHPFDGLKAGNQGKITLSYHGNPPTARQPPWDGGFIWAQDGQKNPWVAVACQGLGASSWWPCKDYQGDEPDSGMSIDVLPHWNLGLYNTAVKSIYNGRLYYQTLDTTKEWFEKTGDSIFVIRQSDKTPGVVNPINTYDVTFYLGDYVSWTDTFQGAKGTLRLSFNCLRENEAKARKQFAVAKEMLRCFEWWLGPYPFYEDGYKLVEAPYLGMEHQSAVAYGNKYSMGYLGRDRSGTGVGMLFDYIIIHESGHEWFGNSITAQDIADNWIHEGFTTYTETLFAEWIAGKDAARRYNIGERQNILNDKPIIGDYGVNDDGSGDKYDKGAAILHMIRTMLADDGAFRQILRGLNDTFYHKIVTTAQVEAYIAARAGRDLTPFFQQYLRTTQIPMLQWYVRGGRLYTRFYHAVDGFSLPVLTEGTEPQVVPTGTAWASVPWKGKRPRFAADFLIETEEVDAAAN